MDISVRRRMMMGGKRKFTISYSGLSYLNGSYYSYLLLPDSSEKITGSGTLEITEGDYIRVVAKGSTTRTSYIKKNGVTMASGKETTLKYDFYPESDAEIVSSGTSTKTVSITSI